MEVLKTVVGKRVPTRKKLQECHSHTLSRQVLHHCMLNLWPTYPVSE